MVIVEDAVFWDGGGHCCGSFLGWGEGSDAPALSPYQTHLFRVMVGTQEVERNIRVCPNDPAIMWPRRHVPPHRTPNPFHVRRESTTSNPVHRLLNQWSCHRLARSRSVLSQILEPRPGSRISSVQSPLGKPFGTMFLRASNGCASAMYRHVVRRDRHRDTIRTLPLGHLSSSGQNIDCIYVHQSVPLAVRSCGRVVPQELGLDISPCIVYKCHSAVLLVARLLPVAHRSVPWPSAPVVLPLE